MDRFPRNIFIAGCCVLGLTVAMGWGGVQTMIKGQVKKQVRIINHTDQYTYWKDFPAPVYLSIQLFNIKNAKELAGGAKPIVEEVGPFVYLEKLYKSDILGNVTIEQIKYRQHREYYFQPEMSKGTEDDMVTVMNVPFLGTASIAHNVSEGNDTMKSKWNGFLDKTEEGLTVTKSVRELLFDGYSVEPLAVLFSDPDFEESQDVKIPESFADGKYGFFKNKNGSDHDEGLLEVKSGRNKSVNFGEVVAWNDTKELTFWKNGSSCNELNGTDGTLFHPFLNSSEPLYIFTLEMCRSLKLEYTETLNVNGLDAYRFRFAESNFQGPHKNEDNWCFCMKEPEDQCNKNGFTSLSTCYGGTPMILSQPHFLGADEDVINSVEGLSPDPEKHSSFYDLNPMSGYIFKVSKRLQYGIELGPISSIKAVGSPANAYVPLFWIEEIIEPYEVNMSFLKIMNYVKQAWEMIRYGFVGFGGFLVLIGLILAFTRRNQPEDSIILVK